MAVEYTDDPHVALRVDAVEDEIAPGDDLPQPGENVVARRAGPRMAFQLAPSSFD